MVVSDKNSERFFMFSWRRLNFNQGLNNSKRRRKWVLLYEFCKHAFMMVDLVSLLDFPKNFNNKLIGIV